MAERVQIQVQAGETVSFPAVCVNCAGPAEMGMLLKQKNGRTYREIEVPLCTQCAAVLKRQSGEEERLVKLRRLAAGFLGAASALLLLLIIPGEPPSWLRALLALLVGGLIAALAFTLFKPAIARAATAEKKAVLAAARLESFSWRSTTFVFNDQTFADRFKTMNKSSLINH